MADHVSEFLRGLRADPLFRQVLKRLKRPDVPVFKPNQGDSQEIRDEWVYRSGRRREYDEIYQFLAGHPPNESAE